MKRSRYSDKQIAYALKQAEGGTAVPDVCLQLGISEATFYVWKKKYHNLGGTEVRELRQLREENWRRARQRDVSIRRRPHCRVSRFVIDIRMPRSVVRLGFGRRGSLLVAAHDNQKVCHGEQRYR